MSEVLGPLGVKAFEGRGISRRTAERFGIHTVRALSGGRVAPDPAGNVIAFPFWQDDAVVAEKYRGPNKKFWQRPGGKRTFWNVEALELAIDETSPQALIITEGEIDALSLIECGQSCVVSVPDGAPATLSQDADDRTGKFEFLWNNREKLAKVKDFIIAADNDEPGRNLAHELVRRLSATRCWFVEYPDGCKDFNDVLVQHGAAGVAAVLANKKHYPVRGLYRLSDYPDVPDLVAYKTGWQTLDQHLQLFLGEFIVVTGIPGHGKSSWVLNLISNLSDLYGWRTALFSPEMPVTPMLRDRLRSMRAGRAMWSDEQRIAADKWIEDNIVFLDADPAGDWENDEDRTLNWIMDKAAEAVMRDAVRLLVIDPWNEVEHSPARRESTTEYIGRGIRELRRFAQQYQIVVLVVAHPTKDIGERGTTRAPTLYDIDGSSHWFNKPDHGVCVYRGDDHGNATRIIVRKVRFSPTTGSRGEIRLKYDTNSGRFDMLAELPFARED